MKPFLVSSHERVQDRVHEEFSKVVKTLGKERGKCEVVCSFVDFGFGECFHVRDGGEVEEGGGVELEELCLGLANFKEKTENNASDAS